MTKVILTIDFVVDLDRDVRSDFSAKDFTKEEFERILSIIRLKRGMPGVLGEDGLPNPSITAQLMYDEGEEEEIKELKKIARKKREEEEQKRAKGSAAARAYKRFMDR